MQRHEKWPARWRVTGPATDAPAADVPTVDVPPPGARALSIVPRSVTPRPVRAAVRADAGADAAALRRADDDGMAPCGHHGPDRS